MASGSKAKSPLDKLLDQALALGFDVKRKGNDGASFSQRDGASKVKILKTFLANQRKKNKGVAADVPGQSHVANPARVVQEQSARLEWIPLISKWTALDHTKEYQRLPMTSEIQKEKVHKLVFSLKIAGSVALTEPVAKVVPVFNTNIKGDDLKTASVESDFSSLIISNQNGESPYVLEFAEPCTTELIGAKLSMVVATGNTEVGTEWLYYKAWMSAEVASHASPNLENAFVAACSIPA
uniref:Coat protein n=2 Tax=Riboviria TaxID=2559587 RepID=A0A2S1CVP8_9VIRU|nr:coat protein [Maize pteridovirus 1]QYU75370.1 coat protein [Maize-associated pteridovirus]